MDIFGEINTSEGEGIGGGSGGGGSEDPVIPVYGELETSTTITTKTLTNSTYEGFLELSQGLYNGVVLVLGTTLSNPAGFLIQETGVYQFKYDLNLVRTSGGGLNIIGLQTFISGVASGSIEEVSFESNDSIIIPYNGIQSLSAGNKIDLRIALLQGSNLDFELKRINFVICKLGGTNESSINLQQVYNNSPNPVILTDPTRGTIELNTGETDLDPTLLFRDTGGNISLRIQGDGTLNPGAPGDDYILPINRPLLNQILQEDGLGTGNVVWKDPPGGGSGNVYGVIERIGAGFTTGQNFGFSAHNILTASNQTYTLGTSIGSFDNGDTVVISTSGRYKINFSGEMRFPSVGAGLSQVDTGISVNGSQVAERINNSTLGNNEVFRWSMTTVVDLLPNDYVFGDASTNTAIGISEIGSYCFLVEKIE